MFRHLMHPGNSDNSVQESHTKEISCWAESCQPAVGSQLRGPTGVCRCPGDQRTSRSLLHPSIMVVIQPLVVLGLLLRLWIVSALPFTPAAGSSTADAPAPTASTVQKRIVLDPFSGIDVCWPFNVGVGSCSNLKYGVFISAEVEVLESMLISVEDSVLVLGTNASFATALPVKVLVSATMEHSSSQADAGSQATLATVQCPTGVCAFGQSHQPEHHKPHHRGDRVRRREDVVLCPADLWKRCPGQPVWAVDRQPDSVCCGVSPSFVPSCRAE